MARLAIKPQGLVKIHGYLEKQKVGRSSRTQPLNIVVLVGDEKRIKIFWYRKEGSHFFASNSFCYVHDEDSQRQSRRGIEKYLNILLHFNNIRKCETFFGLFVF